ncbi:MAG: HD domain-containing protein [Thermoflexales bacterium]|nr:HD domain-containing protein [Thermoflexales bacterium]
MAALLQHPLVERVRKLAAERSASVLLVGGAVRDALLGRETRDFDFAVRGDAIALGRWVANALDGDFYPLDARRGIARVILTQPAAKPITLDFAACIGDDWASDQRARDFTLNAIGIDLGTGELVDATGGLNDLRAGVLRATHTSAIVSDPVRALRAVRLAHQLGLRIDPMTFGLLSAACGALHRVSAERLRDELFEILALPRAAPAVTQLDELGLLATLIPEVEGMRGAAYASQPFTVLQHTFYALAALDEGSAALTLLAPSMEEYLADTLAEERPVRSLVRFGALLHDCAKPDASSAEHAAKGAERAAARARALRLSSDEVNWVRVFIALHSEPNRIAREGTVNDRALYRLLRQAREVAPALALFAIADCWAKRSAEERASNDCANSEAVARAIVDAYSDRWLPLQRAPALISGDDLIQQGVSPSPRLGQILEAVREAQFLGEVNTREQALALAQRLLREP